MRVIGEYFNNELKKGIEVDKLEDENFGNCRGCDQLNENGKYKVKAVVAKYMKQVNKDNSNNRKKEIEDTVKEALSEFKRDSIEKVSLTNKESRFRKIKREYLMTYNAQITVDHKLGIIVAKDLSR